MTATQMASELHKRGIKAELIFRKEGGARITNINGKSFKGSEGNAEARRILGQTLSQTQQKHLQKIRTNKGTFGHRKKKPLDTDLIKLQEKANRAFKQALKEGRFKQKGKLPPKVTRSKIRYRLSKYGKQGALEYLQRAIRYAKGYAYDEAIEAFIQRLEADLKKRNSYNVRAIINALNVMLAEGKKLKEKDFQDLESLAYSWEEGAIGSKDFKTQAMIIIAKAE